MIRLDFPSVKSGSSFSQKWERTSKFDPYKCRRTCTVVVASSLFTVRTGFVHRPPPRVVSGGGSVSHGKDTGLRGVRAPRTVWGGGFSGWRLTPSLQGILIPDAGSPCASSNVSEKLLFLPAHLKLLKNLGFPDTICVFGPAPFPLNSLCGSRQTHATRGAPQKDPDPEWVNLLFSKTCRPGLWVLAP